METIRHFLSKHEPWLIGLGLIAVLYMYQERPFQSTAATAAEGTDGVSTESPVHYTIKMGVEAYDVDNPKFPNTRWGYGVNMPPRCFSNCAVRENQMEKEIVYRRSGSMTSFNDHITKKCCQMCNGAFESAGGIQDGHCLLVGRPNTHYYDPN